MTFAPPVPAAPQATPAQTPTLLLPPGLPLTPDQFALVCEANPDAVLELGADGQLITMTPTGGETSARNSRLLMRLLQWADRQGGWMVFDSSGGFRLADGSVLSPDASVVGMERWQALSPEQRRGFPPLCPDLVIELASASDEGPRGGSALRRKMAAYMVNGAQLGWLLFPGQRAVEIWQSGQGEGSEDAFLRQEPATVLDGSDVLSGLVLELEEIWGV